MQAVRESGRVGMHAILDRGLTLVLHDRLESYEWRNVITGTTYGGTAMNTSSKASHQQTVNTEIAFEFVGTFDVSTGQHAVNDKQVVAVC